MRQPLPHRLVAVLFMCDLGGARAEPAPNGFDLAGATVN